MKSLALVSAAAFLISCSSLDVLGTRVDAQEQDEPEELPNLLEERQQVPLSQVNAQLNQAFLQLFFGDPNNEAVFTDLGDGTGYIEDVANGEVRTDSMAYGLMTTVQLNQREVFDKLWGWTKQKMMNQSGPSEGLLNWRCDTAGESCEHEAATDAMSIIATTLFMANDRWADGGAHNYKEDALNLLTAMTELEDRNGGVEDGVYNCFDLEAALPRWGSLNNAAETPVDYLMPAFYEIWAEHDVDRAEFWQTAAKNARELLSKVGNPATGLLPEVVSYDGEPVLDRDSYAPTTARTLLNLTLDHLWYGPDPWVIEKHELLLDFFLTQGINSYVCSYTSSGAPLFTFNTAAHRSLVALAAGTSPDHKYDVFLEALLEEDIPTGQYRYYDGMIYMLSLLALSGQMSPN